VTTPVLETTALAVGYGGSTVVSGVSVTIGPGTLWKVQDGTDGDGLFICRSQRSCSPHESSPTWI